MRTAASGSPRGCVQFTASGVPSGHAAGFVACVQMPTTPKARIPTPTTFRIDRQRTDLQARPFLAHDAAQRNEEVEAGDTRGDDPAHAGGEVVRRRLVDPVVLDDDHASHLEDLQDHALPDEEPGQRDDERRNPHLRNERALCRSDDRDDPERDEDAEPAREVATVGELQRGRSQRGNAAQKADREIDLRDQQHEDDTERDHRHARHLQDDVHEVRRREEVRRGEAEEPDDEDLADDDWQDTEIPRLEVPDRSLPDALLLFGIRRAEVRGGDVDRAHATTPASTSATPATFVGIPAVMACTTSCCVVLARS